MTDSPVILSTGAITPGGCGATGFDPIRWTSFPIAALDGAGPVFDVYRIPEKAAALERWRREPRLRRCSQLTIHLVEAASQALAARPDIDRSRVGVVGAFFIGCLVSSIRFYRELVRQGRRFASPIIFPETVFNSPLSHLAATLGVGGPIYTQIGDKSAWVTALRTAECWLRRGAADHVLVLGGEEFESHILEVYRRARWLGPTRGFYPAEGAGAVLLGRNEGQTKDPIQIGLLRDGYGFRTRKEATAATEACLQPIGTGEAVMPTAGALWTRKLERAAFTAHQWQRIPVEPLPGEAFPASAAWDTIRAAEWLIQARESRVTIPVWGPSQQVSALQLCRGS